MIDVKNSLVKLLHEHLGIDVIPNNSTENRAGYPFIDYNILTLINFNGEGSITTESLEEDISTNLEVQPKLSVSFNSYSRVEVEAYNKAKTISNYFRHVGYHELQEEGIVVVDVMEISNRTVLEVDNYEFRYGLDVVFRFKDSIERIDREIITYPIDKE